MCVQYAKRNCIGEQIVLPFWVWYYYSYVIVKSALSGSMCDMKCHTAMLHRLYIYEDGDSMIVLQSPG